MPGQLQLDPASRSDAEAWAERAWTWALGLMYEDELELLESGHEEDILFGRWLTMPAGRNGDHAFEPLHSDLRQLARALASVRFTDCYQANRRFAQVMPIAHAAGLDRTKLFRRWGPRALLLAPLVQAYLVVAAGQPRLAAWSWYEDLDFGGADANAYGLQRLNSERTASRLAGLAKLTGDTLEPTTCLPHVTGMHDDPAHPCADEERLARAASELAPFYDRLPSNHADHLELHLRIVVGAQAIVRRALQRDSRVCARAGVSAQAMLACAFPKWLTMGPIGAGVASSRLLAPASVQMPGGDAGLLLLSMRHGLRPVFQLFDATALPSTESAIEQRWSALNALMFSAEGVEYTARQFTQVLAEEDRFERIPGLCEEPPEALERLGEAPELRECGIAIDPTHESWLWLKHGLRLLDGRGSGMALSFVMSATAGRHVGYVTVADLEDPALRADVIARCHLHLRADAEETHSRCIPRVVADHELHTIQSPTFSTRTWMRLLSLLTNQCAVGVGRTRQARLAS